MADASPPVSWRVLMDRTMRWIVFVLGLLLTPFWISYSFFAGSGPKVAFIPPALVLVALVFTSLWKRLVVHIAGEFEPSYFHPHWGAALPLRGSVRTGLVAAAVSVCAGAIVGQSTAVSNRSAIRPAPDAGADNQFATPAQQKLQPGSTPLPRSMLAAKPLGPASQFQPPSAPPAQAASGNAQQLGAQQRSNPPSNQARGNQALGNQKQVATPAQQQTAPQISATPAPYAAIANDDNHPAASRRVRHPRKQATFTSNAPRYRDENYVPRYGPDQYGAWSGGEQRFDARGYDRVYNSYAGPRFGPDARYRRRSRVTPRSPETLYPMQTRPQSWGVGEYR